MSAPPRWAALAVLALSACSGGPTTLLLQLDGPAALTSLDVSLALAGGGSVSRTLPVDGEKLKLPGTLIVELPDHALDVTIDVVGHGAGADLKAHLVITSQPHEQVKVPIDLGSPGDLGGEDLRAVDLGPSPMPTPTPRLISTSYFASGYAFPSSMSHAGFVLNTTGVVDGDLLLVIANVDNGGDSVWPNPFAPGFQQLAQVYFGSDGQTFVVAWKIASHEPATYSGNYGSGVGSSATVISLIAVSGANHANPINAFLASHGTNGTTPSVATSTGVTTSVPNCALIYAAGADWLGSPGSNTFTPPAGYSSLMQNGDHGDSGWDWTSQMIAWSPKASAGATGSLSGTLVGTADGIPWTAVIAVAP